jgi:hypothetical protein
MSDLVKDLRNSGWYFGKPAADRIEKLEAALRWIVEQERQTAHPTVCAIIKTALKALYENPEMLVYKEGYRAVEEAMGHPSPEFWIEKR